MDTDPSRGPEYVPLPSARADARAEPLSGSRPPRRPERRPLSGNLAGPRRRDGRGRSPRRRGRRRRPVAFRRRAGPGSRRRRPLRRRAALDPAAGVRADGGDAVRAGAVEPDAPDPRRRLGRPVPGSPHGLGRRRRGGSRPKGVLRPRRCGARAARAPHLGDAVLRAGRRPALAAERAGLSPRRPPRCSTTPAGNLSLPGSAGSPAAPAPGACPACANARNGAGTAARPQGRSVPVAGRIDYVGPCQDGFVYRITNLSRITLPNSLVADDGQGLAHGQHRAPGKASRSAPRPRSIARRRSTCPDHEALARRRLVPDVRRGLRSVRRADGVCARRVEARLSRGSDDPRLPRQSRADARPVSDGRRSRDIRRPRRRRRAHARAKALLLRNPALLARLNARMGSGGGDYAQQATQRGNEQRAQLLAVVDEVQRRKTHRFVEIPELVLEPQRYIEQKIAVLGIADRTPALGRAPSFHPRRHLRRRRRARSGVGVRILPRKKAGHDDVGHDAQRRRSRRRRFPSDAAEGILPGGRVLPADLRGRSQHARLRAPREAVRVRHRPTQ